MMKLRACELCTADAAVFCPSDAAFLCWSCDSKVHDANFLVARHIRQAICTNCKELSNNGVSDNSSACTACRPSPAVGDLDSLSSDNSSACISSTTSLAKECWKSSRARDLDFSSSSAVNEVTSQQRVRSRVDYFEAEGIFVGWTWKLGLRSDVAVRMACSALRVCLDRWKILPFRVCLAASMWLGLRLGGELSLQVLKRLEEISGVPAKVILAAESKLARALRASRLEQRRRLEVEEGWAEC